MAILLNNIIVYCIVFLKSHVVVLSFLTALFSGEPAVLFLATASSSHGVLPIWVIWLIGYSSALIGEFFWFYLPRISLFSWVSNKCLKSEKYALFQKFMSRVENKKPLRLMFLTRLTPGFSIVLVLYFSLQKMKVKTFFKYIAIVNLFWTSIIVTSGWCIGKGFLLLETLIEDTKIAVTIMVVGGIIGYCLYKKIVGYYLKKDVVV